MTASQVVNDHQLTAALDHLRAAIAILDAVGAQAHIGAQVDLAVHQLEDVLAAHQRFAAPLSAN